jgi:hypothetical protein
MHRSQPLAMLLPVIFAMAGCGSILGLGDEHELEAAEARWAREGPPSYSFVFQRGCFCGGETTGAVRIVVENRVVVSRVYVETGQAVPAQWENLFPAMEGVFQIVHDALRRGADQIDAEYDDRLGYPTIVAIDYVKNAIDDELELRVRELDER